MFVFSNVGRQGLVSHRRSRWLKKRLRPRSFQRSCTSLRSVAPCHFAFVLFVHFDRLPYRAPFVRATPRSQRVPTLPVFPVAYQPVPGSSIQ